MSFDGNYMYAREVGPFNATTAAPSTASAWTAAAR
jgi:hypothetical protein